MPKGVFKRPRSTLWLKHVNTDGPVPLHLPQLGPCWLWNGHHNANGYAIVGFLWHGRPMARASRVGWELFLGPIPDGMDVLHRCDNPGCVRLDHFFLGTQADNVRDCAAKGRLWAQRDPARWRLVSAGWRKGQHKVAS